MPHPRIKDKSSYLFSYRSFRYRYLSKHIVFLTCLDVHVCFIRKLMDVRIIYLISTYMYSFVFKTYTIWSYIIPTSLVAIQLKTNGMI